MKSRHDLNEGEKKIERYLTFLARDRDVAPSTQNQALNALVFFTDMYEKGNIGSETFYFRDTR